MAKVLTVEKKLLKTGTYTYMVTIPKEWVKQLKWRCKQKVKLELRGERVIIKSNQPAKKTVRRKAARRSPRKKA